MNEADNKVFQVTERQLRNFLAKIKTRGPKKCWTWVGAKSRKRGYGTFMCWPYGVIRAHRVMWQITNGQLPPKMEVCHSCDNPSCVNPNHLWLGTHKENCDDRDRKGRDKPFQGEAHPMAKLTNPIILEIRRRYEVEPIGCHRLAKEYGVNKKVIQQIVKRELWKHL